MKTYKKVGNKVFSTESVELEVDVQSIKDRIKTLGEAILSLEKDAVKLGNQTNTYELEKTGLESNLIKINKL